MATEVILVSAGATPTECSVSEWYVSDGQPVSAGDPLFCMETDKVNIDVDAQTDGIVRHLAKEGEMKMSGDLVGYILAPGESDPSAPCAGAEIAASSQPASGLVGETAAITDLDRNLMHDRVRSTPAARKLAREKGVDFRSLNGSGPAGRVIKSDVQQALANVPAEKNSAAPVTPDTASMAAPSRSAQGWQYTDQPVSPRSGSESIPLTAMRKTIARRMVSSLQNNAQLSMDMEFIADETVKLRSALIEEWQEENIRPGYTDLIIKAVAKALRKYPLMNGRYSENEIVMNGAVNIGVAVALEDGLVVPVVHNADKLSIREISLEVSRLAEAARTGTLTAADMADGTFTVSTLGVYGVQSFTPIINEPQVGILGVNRMYDGMEWDGNTPVKKKKMNLSLTWDHRVLDGVPAAQFLSETCKLLQSPHRLLV
ncbi:dihydrolipoamide acetyltransferase family protein [Microbulbifer pacificus]|uniref:Dihydrolipoamide acetyltransferase component of pyruvate dehydrogenase complex n=1 Tax=Microbulbifer pacificus TaxID=407164 RepID=A0AAU0N3U5_9GAMM|nr:dihydrolipoamide acetyltransferase family protein [Microbulbifer pacificus]WOX07040.1 dihydrolipoamide acetyltransferase family protein [Microbulbifer pacificus]